MTPDKNTIEERMIAVGDGHTIYTQLYGNAQAKTTFVFLHGGPGSGCNDKDKTRFNPRTQKVIFIDQRGTGNSTPRGKLEGNQTDLLVDDIATVLSQYELHEVVVVGGSWGSTLALLFALRYPKQTRALILRGIFTGRRVEIDVVVKGQNRLFFPDAWQRLEQAVPEKYRDDPSAYLTKQILSGDPQAAKQAGYAFEQFEASVAQLDDNVKATPVSDFDPNRVIVQSHYLVNNCFLDDNYILDNALKITCPVEIVQGRYDMVCPPFTAYALSQTLPKVHLYMTLGGHSGYDRESKLVTDALLAKYTG